ncbi:hypothetical protein bthur0004_59560 [Bacillus thuringiensis serovar sotto str. T04001]|nr:hypothetical protein bthur0004_59560 [Bacillus thuringiensis serovar sotto str. T04001]
MQKFIIGAASILLFVGCLFLMTDMIIGDTTHTDNKSASERAGSTAMDKAVKVGVLRAQEEIAIEPGIAKKEFESLINKMQHLRILHQNESFLYMLYKSNLQ